MDLISKRATSHVLPHGLPKACSKAATLPVVDLQLPSLAGPIDRPCLGKSPSAGPPARGLD